MPVTVNINISNDDYSWVEDNVPLTHDDNTDVWYYDAEDWKSIRYYTGTWADGYTENPFIQIRDRGTNFLVWECLFTPPGGQTVYDNPTVGSGSVSLHGTVITPDTLSLSRNDAMNQMIIDGLAPGTQTYVFAPGVPQYSLISSSPIAGAEVPVCTAVNFVLSNGVAGPDNIVPNPVSPVRPVGYDSSLTSGGGGSYQEKLILVGHKIIYIGDV